MFILEAIVRSMIGCAKSLIVMCVLILVFTWFIVIGPFLDRADRTYKKCEWQYNAKRTYYMYR